VKYSDLVADWLVELGYTHVFCVAGGNIMHLMESLSRRMRVVPVAHEVAAGVAAEYFNECAGGRERALALVTAGPGLTNILTALAGAYLESRELLVIGGQVKTADLATDGMRQRGIQEIDGISLARPISVVSQRLTDVVSRAELTQLLDKGRTGRKGPVFLEFCLDVQGRVLSDAQIEVLAAAGSPGAPASAQETADAVAEIVARLQNAERPVILVGGGVSRQTMTPAMLDALAALGVPVMTTWNGMDRVPSEYPLYFGRPNTWGQRSANILLQQSDLVIALGTRLGLQQTGFNWQKFAPVGAVVQVDIDPVELSKGHPRVDLPICADANAILQGLATSGLNVARNEWISFCHDVRAAIPLLEPVNSTAPNYLSPFVFATALSKACRPGDVVIPCSSGGAFTVMMQTFSQQAGQTIVTNKGLASMGYGLSGAIGAAISAPDRRTVLVEGDGGFSQNIQELGTAAINNLNLKIFIFSDEGYASIRMTQSSYFGGRYVGCDSKTGLGLPHWPTAFKAYGVPCMELRSDFSIDDADFRAMFDAEGPAGFIVPIDPKQTYFPKIASRVTAIGSMESNPLHLMSPELPEAVAEKVFRFIAPE
jgi:acetolactate synthase I/II/III large subunit